MAAPKPTSNKTAASSAPAKPRQAGRSTGRLAGRRDDNPPTRTLGFPTFQADLAPTAKRLLAAARRLLERSGYNSLTVEAIGREAGENKALIRYHFGDKNGLLVALIDWLAYDTLWEVRTRLSAISAGEDRLGIIIDDAAEGMLADPQSYRLLFDLLPHLLENPPMAAQLAELYRAYREMSTRAFWADARGGAPEVVKDLAALNVALVDGLAVQLLAEPGSIDVHRALGEWRRFVENTLGTLAEPSAEA